MTIRTNILMEQYLEKTSFDFQEESVELPFELENLINRVFLTENGCIILKGVNNNEQNPKFETDFEKCEWEYNETHFHADAYSKEAVNELDFLILALECSKRLERRLRHSFPNEGFRISVSFSESIRNNNNEIEQYGSSTIRFHQIRSSCENKMRIDDLTRLDFFSPNFTSLKK